ncbi:flavin reductase family protein [Consotaella salsifontis]|uniref:NADH-FMN oxidoreductase RutF, flavin reductase (DIM6/NTAB) family n=1 Tax=Consotaella salsifontis TaxID=1365950 RepID=A0A1T4L8D1_9HYPH|nr:flavin reductase family protein [Consotaella salsifontis]SJZ50801.1 NADH-FMN oxidoreductase RutF, flavin reductase (DIM6/NTAB) family [Consotaella salsifontis]
MFYETRDNRHGLPHDPFKAIVAPRPIGWISTRTGSGAVNLAPYSFFNAISDQPKLVMFSSAGMKDTATFAIESGEFVANLATEALAEAVNRSSAPAPRGESEFAIAGLTEAPCILVAAPRVAESPAALECKVTEWFHPKSLEGDASANVVVIGEVVGIHLDESIIKDGIVDMTLARPLARLGYFDYSAASQVFQMRRPKAPDASDIPPRHG